MCYNISEKSTSLEYEILFWGMKSVFKYNGVSIMHRLKEKLFSIYITVNKFQPPTENVSDSTHILPPVSSSCHSGPTKKTHGTVNHRLGAADRMWGYDGQWRNMCLYWELNPSYRWQVSVSVEAYDRWHLTPLNSRSADIPLVSTSCPIRIDCSTTTLLRGQVNAVSSLSLTMMMLCIDLTTAVCCVEWIEKISA